MPRPNRLYTINGKYYYIKDGKKVFVKVPAGVTQKQVSKINIKNIIKLAETKRVVRKKKRRNLSYQKKIAPTMEKAEQSGKTPIMTAGFVEMTISDLKLKMKLNK